MEHSSLRPLKDLTYKYAPTCIGKSERSVKSSNFLSDKISTDKTVEFWGSVSKILSLEILSDKILLDFTERSLFPIQVGAYL